MQPEGKTMNTKHTPGPWEIHPSYADTKGIIVDEGGEEAFISWSTCVRSKVNEKITCDVRAWTIKNGGWPRVDRKDEMLANARLIAAAPELLEAMKELTTRVFFNCPELDRAIQAIAEAEGD